MSSQLDEIADRLARAALADARITGDTDIVDQIGGILGASSQTLEEAYKTAVRIRRSEARAIEILERRAAARKTPE